MEKKPAMPPVPRVAALSAVVALHRQTPSRSEPDRLRDEAIRIQAARQQTEL